MTTPTSKAKYIIVSDHSCSPDMVLERIQTAIDVLVIDGYRPQGGVSLACCGDMFYVCQAMSWAGVECEC